MREKQLEAIRQDFPILDVKVNNKSYIYLDNAATMQMPSAVMDRLQFFYTTHNSNIHRGVHQFSMLATAEYEAARRTVCTFIGADSSEEIIFTAGTTAAINMVAGMVGEKLQSEDEILITQMEHHSNFIPWQQLAKKKKLKLKVVPIDQNGVLDMEQFCNMLTDKTRMVAVTEVSNLTGIENPVKEMISYVRARTNAFVLVDGAQGMAHCQPKMIDLKPDFYCFSGHKLGAPTGTGVLYMRKEIQQKMMPVWYGGGTVMSVTEDNSSFLEGPAIYESGTPNYAGVIGLDEALKYWMERDAQLSMESNSTSRFVWEDELLQHLETGLQTLEGVRILGKTEHRKGCLAVCFSGIHSFDFCKFLDLYGIAARSGHHCAMPYLQALGADHAVRFSVAAYNTLQEMDQTIQSCEQILKQLQGKTRWI